MRERLTDGTRPPRYFELARSLIGDADNDCRWQAIIVVGEFLQENPEAVWQVICEYGISEDFDMRVAIAIVLLEHLLEDHFDIYFPRVKKKIEGGLILMADTLSRCSPFGEAKARWHEVESLVDRFPRSPMPDNWT